MRRVLVFSSIVLLCAVGLRADDALTKADATRFRVKLAQIEKNAATPAKRAARVTPISDAELNSYLRFLAGDQVPVGIAEPILHSAGDGRVTGHAVVDLDAVRTQKKRTWSDPLAYLSGRLPVAVQGTLTTANGVGRFALESAEISGVTVPKSLLQELLTYYSKSPERPNGISMDDPFQLPSAIKEIKVGVGTATVVQ
ncbi:MAG TPA: hypothetical protein VFZ98_11430 [Vicinamibacterales bacterium]